MKVQGVSGEVYAFRSAEDLNRVSRAVKFIEDLRINPPPGFLFTAAPSAATGVYVLVEESEGAEPDPFGFRFAVPVVKDTKNDPFPWYDAAEQDEQVVIVGLNDDDVLDEDRRYYCYVAGELSSEAGDKEGYTVVVAVSGVTTAPAGDGFFARLTTSSGGKWKWIRRTLSSGGAWMDLGTESVGYTGVPVEYNGTYQWVPATAQRVWMKPSAEDGFYEFMPEGYADGTHPGLMSILDQEFDGKKYFWDQIKVGDTVITPAVSADDSPASTVISLFRHPHQTLTRRVLSNPVVKDYDVPDPLVGTEGDAFHFIEEVFDRATPTWIQTGGGSTTYTYLLSGTRSAVSSEVFDKQVYPEYAAGSLWSVGYVGRVGAPSDNPYRINNAGEQVDYDSHRGYGTNSIVNGTGYQEYGSSSYGSGETYNTAFSRMLILDNSVDGGAMKVGIRRLYVGARFGRGMNHANLSGGTAPRMVPGRDSGQNSSKTLNINGYDYAGRSLGPSGSISMPIFDTLGYVYSSGVIIHSPDATNTYADRPGGTFIYCKDNEDESTGPDGYQGDHVKRWLWRAFPKPKRGRLVVGYNAGTTTEQPPLGTDSAGPEWTALDPPTDDGTYSLKVTVSGGVTTVAWTEDSGGGGGA